MFWFTKDFDQRLCVKWRLLVGSADWPHAKERAQPCRMVAFAAAYLSHNQFSQNMLIQTHEIVKSYCSLFRCCTSVDAIQQTNSFIQT